MKDLRDAFAKQSTSHTVDLGSGEWEANEPTLRLRGRAVTGDGYIVHIAPRKDRNAPAIVLRGDGTSWTGNGSIVGSMPDGHGYYDRQEAQHAIACLSLANGEVSGVRFRNIWGDGVYVGKEAGGPWCTNLRVHDVGFDEMGRHAVTADAWDGGVLARAKIGRCNLSPVDCEPPGGDWGCRYWSWLDSDIYDHGGGFVFANKGEGRSDTVHHILLGGIRCHNRAFSMAVNPIPKPGAPEIRRAHYWARHCSGILVPGDRQSPVSLRHADHVAFEHVDQPTPSGVPLVEQHFCTDVTVI